MLVVFNLKDFHSYKIHILQDLGDEEPNRRAQFCEELSIVISGVLRNIVKQ